ncbi:DUF1566 domain-containing protein [Mucisphaera sp.]|uniref:Lcl C-terminal domain-containing protein n=1 Tax=Mucisphaera sp. TaxID=2913024 RepID=UPI003D0A450E
MLLAAGSLSQTHAALLDRGHGLIYDTGTGLTWLQDANYAQTSGYDADGQMHLAAARSFVNNLVYAGFDDWRLPHQHYASYELDVETLLEVSLGNHHQGASALSNNGPFHNISPNTGYWHASDRAHSNQTWYYTYAGPTQTRVHYYGDLGGNYIPWPVRRGDVLNQITPDYDNKLIGGALNTLQGWDASGRGTATLAHHLGRNRVKLTTGSAIHLHQQLDTPASPFIFSYQVDMSETWGQDLTVYLNNQQIDHVPNTTPGLVTRTITIDQPARLNLTSTQLRFTLDDHAAGKVAYLSDVTLTPIPEPTTTAWLLTKLLAISTTRRRQDG